MWAGEAQTPYAFPARGEAPDGGDHGLQGFRLALVRGLRCVRGDLRYSRVYHDSGAGPGGQDGAVGLYPGYLRSGGGLGRLK